MHQVCRARHRMLYRSPAERQCPLVALGFTSVALCRLLFLCYGSLVYPPSGLAA